MFFPVRHFRPLHFVCLPVSGKCAIQTKRHLTVFSSGLIPVLLSCFPHSVQAQSPNVPPEPSLPESVLLTPLSRLPSADEFFQQASAYSQIGDYTKAVALLTRAIELEPKTASLFLHRGQAYMRIAIAEQRIRLCTAQVTGQTADATTYLDRGFAYYNTGEYDKAIADYSEALQRRSDYAAAYLGRGLAYIAVRKVREAIADYEKAFSLRPDIRPVSPDSLRRVEERPIRPVEVGVTDVSDVSRSFALTSNFNASYVNR